MSKIDKVAEELAELRTEVTQIRTEHGAELAELRTELKQLRTDFRAELRTEIGNLEQRLSQKISTEVAHALGVIEERFAELFGLLDEKHSGAVSELRADLDAHRHDRSIHVSRG